MDSEEDLIDRGLRERERLQARDAIWSEKRKRYIIALLVALFGFGFWSADWPAYDGGRTGFFGPLHPEMPMWAELLYPIGLAGMGWFIWGYKLAIPFGLMVIAAYFVAFYLIFHFLGVIDLSPIRCIGTSVLIVPIGAIISHFAYEID